MAYRNIIITQPLDLTIKNKQLMIQGDAVTSIPLEDINCIVIENRGVKLSSYFLQVATDENICIYICDEKHIPATVVLPVAKHSRHFRMLTAQIEIPKPRKNRLWQQIVKQKIYNQALCLELLELDGYMELHKMVKEVQSADKTNVEAKAASFYFKHLFGLGFSRGYDHIINSALNYGYSIIRGQIARSIICYGMEPSIGLNHYSQLNSFNLADDLIEPYRPLVDLYVATHFDISEVNSQLTPDIKHRLVDLVNFDMDISGEKYAVHRSIDKMVGSFSSCLNGTIEELTLPELIPLQTHSYE